MRNKPTLEEVKKYFENAETVKCLSEKKSENIVSDITEEINYWEDAYWIRTKKSNNGSGSIQLWDIKKGYAKIMTEKQPVKKFKPLAMRCTQEQFEAVKGKLKNVNSITNFKDYPYLVNCDEGNTISNIYEKSFNWVWDKKPEIHETWNEKIFLEACGIETEKKFEITKDQILKLHHNTVLSDLKEWFPEVFKKELEVGKWYKSTQSNCIVCISDFTKRGFNGYGFNDDLLFKKIIDDNWTNDRSLWKEATTQEVETALIAESKKRGFKYNVFIERNFDQLKDGLINEIEYPNDPDFYYNSKQDYLECHGFVVYSKGKWATIISTITREEAEKRLGVKIE